MKLELRKKILLAVLLVGLLGGVAWAGYNTIVDSSGKYSWDIDSNGYGSVDVVTSGLPTGAATAANQSTQITLDQNKAPLVVSVTPTLDTGAYATGDLMGGKLSVAGAASASGGSGKILSVVVVDDDKQLGALTIQCFAADPTNTTHTDQAAFAPADADLATAIASVDVLSTDYQSYSTNSVASRYNLNIPYDLATGTTLYCDLVSRDAKTYAADGITLLFFLERD